MNRGIGLLWIIHRLEMRVRARGELHRLRDHHHEVLCGVGQLWIDSQHEYFEETATPRERDKAKKCEQHGKIAFGVSLGASFVLMPDSVITSGDERLTRETVSALIAPMLVPHGRKRPA